MHSLFAMLTRNWRGLLKLILFLAFIVVANLASEYIVDALSIDLRPSNEDLFHRFITATALVYAALIAVPFVPGVEIGITLIAMLGPRIVFLVYVSTIFGLTIAFVAGRCVPARWWARLFDAIGLRSAAMLMRTAEPLNTEERLALLMSKAPNRLLPFLLRHRYLALAMLVNLPGNILIGGGGGISFVAGSSRLYSFPGFLLTIALAVSPVPLLVLFMGPEILGH